MGYMLNDQRGDRDKINKISVDQGRARQPGTTGNPAKTTVVLSLSGLEARVGGLASRKLELDSGVGRKVQS